MSIVRPWILLQETQHSCERTSSKHWQGSGSSTRVRNRIASRRGRRTSRIARVARGSRNTAASTAGGTVNHTTAALRGAASCLGRVGCEDGGAGAGLSLVLVVGIIIEVGRGSGVNACNQRDGGRRGDRATAAGSCGSSVESGGGEAA